MNLHDDPDAFEDLSIMAASDIGIPATATRRDYYIVLMLQRLAESQYASKAVFKGGTSLSKCYPDTIMRFSEDIDLTYMPEANESEKHIEKALLAIERIMSKGAILEKIPGERNNRNKSSFISFGEDALQMNKIKLEIGSSIRPEPYEAMELRTYIQEYLEKTCQAGTIQKYDLAPVTINTLRIERTFLDKVMSVKRHAICGTLLGKSRHIYDVRMLFPRSEIQAFLQNKEALKKLLRKTKETDAYYLQKRNIPKTYNPTEKYDFDSWSQYLDDEIRKKYEQLHENLLYTDQKQNFQEAVDTFKKIDEIFRMIDE